MSRLLFVSQAMLDSWAGQGKIDLVGNVMTLLAGAGKGRSYALDPAVRFLAVLGEERDPNELVHKVKTVAQLKEIGAEPVGDSCILGELAYQVEPGFLAEAAALAAAATAEAARPPAAAAAGAPAGGEPAGLDEGTPGARRRQDLDRKRKEAEALARFLWENLS